MRSQYNYAVVYLKHEGTAEETEASVCITASDFIRLMEKVHDTWRIPDERIIGVRRMSRHLAQRLNDEWLASLPEEDLHERVRERLELDGR